MTEPVKKTAAKKTAAKKTVAKKTAATRQATAAKRTAPAKKTAPVTKGAAAKKAAPSTKTAAVTKTAPSKATAAVKAAARRGADGAVESRFFKRAVDQARRVANDPEQLREIAHRANHSSALRAGPFSSVLEDFAALIRLVVAYARGIYRQIPLEKLVLVVGGLLYVVSPIDMVPDAILVAGFLDDATVIAWVIKGVRDELDAFREWEAGMKD